MKKKSPKHTKYPAHPWIELETSVSQASMLIELLVSQAAASRESEEGPRAANFVMGIIGIGYDTIDRLQHAYYNAHSTAHRKS